MEVKLQHCYGDTLIEEVVFDLTEEESKELELSVMKTMLDQLVS